MCQSIQIKRTTPLLIAAMLMCSWLLPKALATDLDGVLVGNNTADGVNVLINRTTGVNNSGFGFEALKADKSGTGNTATGTRALYSNVTGLYNTADGAFALALNTGSYNTATGSQALYRNSGGQNTAVGYYALGSNTTGASNTAIGSGALTNNTIGGANTATGYYALFSNSSGNYNTAYGSQALQQNTTGIANTAIGWGAGYGLLQGGGNVYLGAISGATEESNHTYIRNINNTTVSGAGTDTVTVNLSSGLLGHLSSSRRYKKNIQPMDKASEVLFALKPVSYRFKREIDPTQSLDYGLIAEDVAEVDPNLAIRDGNGRTENVRYNAINAMLLNEFLKEHRRVEELKSTVAKQEAKIAQQESDFQSKLAEQQKEIKALTSGLKKVNAQLEVSKTPQIVASNTQ